MVGKIDWSYSNEDKSKTEARSYYRIDGNRHEEIRRRKNSEVSSVVYRDRSE